MNIISEHKDELVKIAIEMTLNEDKIDELEIEINKIKSINEKLQSRKKLLVKAIKLNDDLEKTIHKSKEKDKTFDYENDKTFDCEKLGLDADKIKMLKKIASKHKNIGKFDNCSFVNQTNEINGIPEHKNQESFENFITFNGHGSLMNPRQERSDIARPKNYGNKTWLFDGNINLIDASDEDANNVIDNANELESEINQLSKEKMTIEWRSRLLLKNISFITDEYCIIHEDEKIAVYSYKNGVTKIKEFDISLIYNDMFKCCNSGYKGIFDFKLADNVIYVLLAHNCNVKDILISSTENISDKESISKIFSISLDNFEINFVNVKCSYVCYVGMGYNNVYGGKLCDFYNNKCLKINGNEIMLNVSRNKLLINNLITIPEYGMGDCLVYNMHGNLYYFAGCLYDFS